MIYTAKKIQTENITIEGNIIKRFGYGIFSLGMGGNLDDQMSIKSIYNRNNKFVNNFIEEIYKGGI